MAGSATSAWATSNPENVPSSAQWVIAAAKAVRRSAWTARSDAVVLVPRYEGRAIERRMPMIMITTMSSMSTKPLSAVRGGLSGCPAGA